MDDTPPRSRTATLAALLLLLLLPPVLGACATGPSFRTPATGIGPRLDRAAEAPDPATPIRCAARRRALAAGVGDGVVFVLAGGEPPDHGRYQANSDFHWLTGVSVPDVVLVIEAEAGALAAERLYLPARDERFELWNGPRLAPGAEAEVATGIAETRDLARLAEDVAALVASGRPLHRIGREHDERPELEDVAWTNADARELLKPLQTVKSEEEIAVVREVVAITQAGLAEAMAVALPGAFESTAEAVLEAGFRRRGASFLAFPSICGSGPNTCVLHYRDNERRLEEGDLLVMDVGAKLHHYCADVTRTIPVSGRFTPRQREVYTLVWEASRRAAATLKPGSTLKAADDAARAYFEEHGGYQGWFKHSVGHGLGLLVHDWPKFRDELEPGMVVTIEPGLYIAEEDLGVRIEDDWLITEDGAELLSDSLPSQPDELEAFLARIRD